MAHHSLDSNCFARFVIFAGTRGHLLGIQHAVSGPHELGSVRPTEGGNCNSNSPQNRSGVSEEITPKQGHRLQEGELNPNMTCKCVTSTSAAVYSWRLMDQEVLSRPAAGGVEMLSVDEGWVG